MASQETPKFCTTGEAAKLLNLSRKLICKLFDNGYIEGFVIPVSNHRRILSNSLTNLLEKLSVGMPINSTQSQEDENIKRNSVISRVYTTGEVARICGISRQGVIRRYNKGLINGYLIPGSRYRKITHKNLVDFMIKNNIPLEGLDNFLEPDSSKNL